MADLTMTLRFAEGGVINDVPHPEAFQIEAGLSWPAARTLFAQLADALGDGVVAEALGLNDEARVYLAGLLADDAERIQRELVEGPHVRPPLPPDELPAHGSPVTHGRYGRGTLRDRTSIQGRVDFDADPYGVQVGRSLWVFLGDLTPLDPAGDVPPHPRHG